MTRKFRQNRRKTIISGDICKKRNYEPKSKAFRELLLLIKYFLLWWHIAGLFSPLVTYCRMPRRYIATSSRSIDVLIFDFTCASSLKQIFLRKIVNSRRLEFLLLDHTACRPNYRTRKTKADPSTRPPENQLQWGKASRPLSPSLPSAEEEEGPREVLKTASTSRKG